MGLPRRSLIRVVQAERYIDVALYFPAVLEISFKKILRKVSHLGSSRRQKRTLRRSKDRCVHLSDRSGQSRKGSNEGGRISWCWHAGKIEICAQIDTETVIHTEARKGIRIVGIRIAHKVHRPAELERVPPASPAQVVVNFVNRYGTSQWSRSEILHIGKTANKKTRAHGAGLRNADSSQAIAYCINYCRAQLRLVIHRESTAIVQQLRIGRTTWKLRRQDVSLESFQLASPKDRVVSIFRQHKIQTSRINIVNSRLWSIETQCIESEISEASIKCRGRIVARRELTQISNHRGINSDPRRIGSLELRRRQAKSVGRHRNRSAVNSGHRGRRRGATRRTSTVVNKHSVLQGVRRHLPRC